MAFGRLERRAEAQPISEINVTPLVDVMLVLVVILILTAPLLASSLHLELPRSDVAQPVQAMRSVLLAVDAGGQIFLNDQAVSEAEAARELIIQAEKDPQTEVQLRADVKVPYGRVIAVLSLAQKAGLSRVGFIADPLQPAQQGR
jgi:biopolymer transport protein TolR